MDSKSKSAAAKKTPTEPVKDTPKEMKLLAAPRQLIVDTPKQILNKGEDFFEFHKKKASSMFDNKWFGMATIFLLLLAGYYALSPLFEKIFTNQDSLIQGYVPVSSNPKSMSMDIQNPDDELLNFSKAVVVSGKTAPKASIVISNGDSFTGTEADQGGHFQKVVDLRPGVNQIIVQAFDVEGNTKSDTRMVYYSEERL